MDGFKVTVVTTLIPGANFYESMGAIKLNTIEMHKGYKSWMMI